MLGYAWRDLVRNPRRTLASLAGVVLGVGLFAGVLFFIDGSGATMTSRAVAPLAIDMQRVLTSPLGPRGLTLTQASSAPGRGGGRRGDDRRSTVPTSGTDAVHEVVVNDEPPPPLRYVQGTTTSTAPQPDIAGQSFRWPRDSPASG